MDLTNMIPGGAGEEKTPQQQLSKEEYAAMKKQQREEVWAGRRPGTGGVPKRGFFKGIFRFYGTVQYAENTQPSVDLRTESRSNGGKIL